VVENETHGYGYFQFLFIWPLRVIARLLRKFIKIKTFGDVGENAVQADCGSCQCRPYNVARALKSRCHCNDTVVQSINQSEED